MQKEQQTDFSYNLAENLFFEAFKKQGYEIKKNGHSIIKILKNPRFNFYIISKNNSPSENVSFSVIDNHIMMLRLGCTRYSGGLNLNNPNSIGEIYSIYLKIKSETFFSNNLSINNNYVNKVKDFCDEFITDKTNKIFNFINEIQLNRNYSEKKIINALLKNEIQHQIRLCTIN